MTHRLKLAGSGRRIGRHNRTVWNRPVSDPWQQH